MNSALSRYRHFLERHPVADQWVLIILLIPPAMFGIAVALFQPLLFWPERIGIAVWYCVPLLFCVAWQLVASCRH